MSSIIGINPGALIVYDTQNRAVPIVIGRHADGQAQEWADYLDARFVADPVNGRIDWIGIQLDSETLGTWHVDVITGVDVAARHPIWELTTTGSPTGGLYQIGVDQIGGEFTINFDDDQAAVQAAWDAYASPGQTVITGDGSGFIVDWQFNTHVTMTVTAQGLTGGTDPLAVITETQVGSDGNGIEPAIPTNFFPLARMLVNAAAASWDDSTVEDWRSPLSPVGLNPSAPSILAIGGNAVLTQGVGTIDPGTANFSAVWTFGSSGTGIMSGTIDQLFSGGTAGEAGQQIVIDMGPFMDIGHGQGVIEFYGGADRFPIGPAFGTLGGSPFIGWWAADGGDSDIVLFDDTFTEVTTALAPGDELHGSFTVATAND